MVVGFDEVAGVVFFSFTPNALAPLFSLLLLLAVGALIDFAAVAAVDGDVVVVAVAVGPLPDRLVEAEDDDADVGVCTCLSFGAANNVDDQTLTSLFENPLRETQDRLAHAVVGREIDRFQTILNGRSGMNGFYDAWRTLRAKFKGQRFSSDHGNL